MRYAILILLLFSFSCTEKKKQTTYPPAIVFQTDFGLKDGAVSAMKGVAHFIAPESPLYDLTHEIPAYNIWEAAYRLNQAIMYWPPGTVFVSVVDPGVGTARKPVVMQLSTGQYIVTPDNGTLTLVSKSIEVYGVRIIDTSKYRWPGSEGSHTFHGRDVFAYVAAGLASGSIKFKDMGPELKELVTIPYQRATLENGVIQGNIPVLDIQYGNVWSNIPEYIMSGVPIRYGDNVEVTISKNSQPIFTGTVPFVRTFGDVPEGKLLGYMNSLGNFSLAINMGSFADSFKVASGAEWSMVLRKIK